MVAAEYSNLAGFIKSMFDMRDPSPEPVGWLVNQDFSDQIISSLAKHWWREQYRSARVLGNRQLAFDVVGNRRKGFR